MKKLFYISVILLLVLVSCENQDWEYSDYDYKGVYFAYQYPVRTITLGEDIYDNSLDNEHKCKIMATTAGVYENNSDVTIDITVDNTLCNGLLFGQGGSDVVAMPGNYYTLASNKITIPKGQLFGGVEVQLTDAFFADPLALSNNYVIPLRMTKVENADTILSGKAAVQNPNRVIADNWEIAPKDYVLYAVKYINPWHGFYLRRGKDVATGKNGNTSLDTTIVRHKQYVEKDEVFKLSTLSLTTTDYPVVYKNKDGSTINCTLILTFDNAGNCTVTTNSQTFTASGSGKFVKRGEKKSWGGLDRDAIYLNYEVDLNDRHIVSTDTVVLRNRGVGMETYIPRVK